MLWVLGILIPALGVLGSSVWIVIFARLVFARSRIPRLSEVASAEPEGGWPSLAIVFAAKDEAENVARTARAMLSQDYPELRVIAIDDRSTDGTGAILDAIAAEDQRLQVVHIQELPEGWLGKCNALQQGADFASDGAEWLLFTDGDVILSPGTLRRAITYGVEKGLDHLTATPDVPTEAFVERVFMTMFTLSFVLFAPPWDVANRRKKAAIGIGAFNLIRAEVFKSVGGFRNIRLSVDDDMKLGQIIKFAGYRNGFVSGKGDVTVRWHVGAMNMIRGLEKNFFAAIDYRLWMIPVSVGGLMTVGLLPYLALITGPGWVRLICAAGIASPCGIMATMDRQSRLAWYHALFIPLGACLMLAALLRSTYFTLKRGGVTWRHQHYPLAMLKTHVRIRNRWMKELWLSTR